MRGRLGRLAAAIAILVASPTMAQLPAPAPPPVVMPGPAVPPLTPAQEAAALLGRWETCIDLASQFLAYSTLGSKRSIANVERKCVHFEAQVRPVLARSLTDMMYGSSGQQVTEQTEIALEALRRHINTRAVAAVKKVRTRKK